MAPPVPFRRDPLPKKFHSSGTSNSNRFTMTTANSRRNEPLRATETLPVPSRVPLSQAPPLQPPPVDSSAARVEEQQLNAAYTLYLQQLALNMLAQDMAQFYSKVEADQCAEGCVDTEVATSYKLIREELVSHRIIIKTVEHLLDTDNFLEVYTELSRLFEKGKLLTLEELKRALESKFKGIALENIKFYSSLSNHDGDKDTLNLDELIARLKKYLAPQEKPTDGKSFLALFLDSMSELIKISTGADETKNDAEHTKKKLMDLSSMTVSSNLLKGKRQEETREST